MPDRPIIDALTKGRPVANAIIKGVLNNVATMPTNTLSPQDAPAVAKDVAAVIASDPKVAIVPVKSGWLSKINWTQGAGAAGALAVYFLVPGTTEAKIAALTAIGVMVPLVTVIIKQFFTNSISPQSKG